LAEFMIKDINLAPQGLKKISWAASHMPVLSNMGDELEQIKPFAGKKVVICLHLEAKTGYLAMTLQRGGAKVAVVASNPLSTQDDVVAALVKQGITAYAWYGATGDEYRLHLNKALDFEPDLIVDDGGDLVSLLHGKRRDVLPGVVGGSEETTTGILRLKAMEKEGTLSFPMMAVNDALSKYLFDNRYGTGQSVWDGINRTTNLVVAGKNVVIIGYGWCGKGVAMRAKGMGARVLVCEIDPIKANEALMDGFQVMPLIEASPLGDYFVTVTGNKSVIHRAHFQVMKDQAILANAGHFDVEIDKVALEEMSQEMVVVRPNVQQYRFSDGRALNLLAEGRLVNLAAGDGHPAEIMDMSFALQAKSLQYILESGDQLKAGVHKVPEVIDKGVAQLRLQALGYEIDQLTEEQKKYLDSWEL